MDDPVGSSLIKKIKNKTKDILTDNKNANHVLDLLKYTQSNQISVAAASCQALGKVFTHFLKSRQFCDSGKTTVAEADLSKDDQFSAWLKEQFAMTCDILCDHLGHESVEVKTSALDAIILLLQAEGESHKQRHSDKLIEGIISQLLSKDTNQSEIIQLLPSVLAAWDDTAHMSSVCLILLRKTLKLLNQEPTDILLVNGWRTIRQIAAADLDDKGKRQLTGVVCEFLKNKMPTSLYKEILTSISSIMEKMSTPLRLADFLSESFNIGGAISLMSLHGLFILMHQYNLDYPDFYTHLYSMLEPSIFSVRYKARFFHLADVFLSSTHLPSYLVAAFAKRLARISLHAPASGIHIVIPFILNLISRHPACEVLIHRTDAQTEMDRDPYLPEERDPSKCHALDSCLWELQCLEHHYDPNLSQKAQKRHIAEQDLAPLLETTTEDFIASEAKKVKKEVPVTFVRPQGLGLPGNFTL